MHRSFVVERCLPLTCTTQSAVYELLYRRTMARHDPRFLLCPSYAHHDTIRVCLLCSSCSHHTTIRWCCCVPLAPPLHDPRFLSAVSFLLTITRPTVLAGPLLPSPSHDQLSVFFLGPSCSHHDAISVFLRCPSCSHHDAIIRDVCYVPLALTMTRSSVMFCMSLLLALTRSVLFAVSLLLQHLSRAGYNGLSLHGGKDQTDRDFTIADFKNKSATLMVATSVAGR